MKKLFASIATVALLAGCTIFGESAPPPVKEGEKSTPQHFERSTSDMHKAWTEKILEMVPEINIPEKYENNFLANANLNIPDAGNIKIDIQSHATNDISDMKNPLADTKITAKVDLEPDTNDPFNTIPKANVDAEAMFRMVKQKIFFSLVKLDLNIPDIPMGQFEAIIKPFVGQWFGGTYEELEKLFQDQGISADFSRMKNGMTSPNEMLDIKGPLSEALEQMHFLKLKDTLTAKDGMLQFSVELDKEKTKKSGEVFLDFLQETIATKSNVPATVKDQMKKDFDNSKEDFNNYIDGLDVKGVLAISQKNPEYFTFSGDVTYDEETGKLEIKWLEGEKTLSITEPNEQVASVLIEIKTDNEESDFTIKSPKEEETLLTGKNSPDKFQLNLFDPNKTKEEALLFTVDLDKDGDDYSGKITIPGGDVIINVQKLTITNDLLGINLAIAVGGKKIGDVEIKWTMKEVDKVDISDPDNYEGFDKLMEKFQAAMGAVMMMSPPGGNNPDYENFDPTTLEGELNNADPEALNRMMMEAEGTQPPM